jgi:uncharacterized ferredoxin-like protein
MCCSFWSFQTGGNKSVNNAEIDWNKEFPVNSICRADVKEAGFPEEQVARLTDEDMQAIAQKMADLYNENGYWQDLEEAYRIIREEHNGRHDSCRTYEIFSISRTLLRSLGFTDEQISLLSDEDMQAIAETQHENLLHAAGSDINEEVGLVTRVCFAERCTDNQTIGKED